MTIAIVVIIIVALLLVGGALAGGWRLGHDAATQASTILQATITRLHSDVDRVTEERDTTRRRVGSLQRERDDLRRRLTTVCRERDAAMAAHAAADAAYLDAETARAEWQAYANGIKEGRRPETVDAEEVIPPGVPIDESPLFESTTTARAGLDGLNSDGFTSWFEKFTGDGITELDPATLAEQDAVIARRYAQQDTQEPAVAR